MRELKSNVPDKYGTGTHNGPLAMARRSSGKAGVLAKDMRLVFKSGRIRCLGENDLDASQTKCQPGLVVKANRIPCILQESLAQLPREFMLYS